MRTVSFSSSIMSSRHASNSVRIAAFAAAVFTLAPR